CPRSGTSPPRSARAPKACRRGACVVLNTEPRFRPARGARSSMEERLQKIISRAGVASRRAGEEIILAGRVRVNGRVVTELGAKADLRKDRVEVDGQRVTAESA